ncbi:MAG: hypothetical protein FWC39_08200 [Bacteroidetes bacterium]|nr:hypothetical protein [Bacteroidota bacterium]
MLPFQGVYMYFYCYPKALPLGWVINGFQPFAMRKIFAIESFTVFCVCVFQKFIILLNCKTKNKISAYKHFMILYWKSILLYFFAIVKFADLKIEIKE